MISEGKRLTPAEKAAWEAYLNEFPWEWWLSLSIGVRDYTQVLKGFMFQLQKREKLQLAYIGLFSRSPCFHIHVLAMGMNRRGETLYGLDAAVWKKEWRELTHYSADIRPVYSDGVYGYLVEHMKGDSYELVGPYNKKLLRRRRGAAPTYAELPPGLASLVETE